MYVFDWFYQTAQGRIPEMILVFSVQQIMILHSGTLLVFQALFPEIVAYCMVDLTGCFMIIAKCIALGCITVGHDEHREVLNCSFKLLSLVRSQCEKGRKLH